MTRAALFVDISVAVAVEHELVDYFDNFDHKSFAADEVDHAAGTEPDSVDTYFDDVLVVAFEDACVVAVVASVDFGPYFVEDE